MAEIVNLNQMKKAAKRAASKVQADANAARFGQSKSEKLAQKQREQRAARDLDGHKRP